ncbi:MAG: hypothetical protein K2Q09_08460, partial [Phycisphaerales bacterium]|nr:hypothetical protein [Phycisphaerales bacterium]
GSRNSWTNPRTLLGGTCLCALALSLTPWRYSFWLQAPANLVSIFVSPLQNGFTRVLTPIAVRPRVGVRGEPDGPDVEVLRTRYLQLEEENRQLRSQVESLQQGVKVYADLGTPRVVAASLGMRGSMLQVRTDHVQPLADGTSPIGAGSVAVLHGVELVGRVVAAGNKVTLVQLVTDQGAGEVRGVVRPGEAAAAGDVAVQPSEAGSGEYGVRLTPTADGRLSGSVYLISPGASARGKRLEPVKPGARVRLLDPSWPRFAQMLILGEVESVGVAQNDRQTVTVRPMYEVRELAGAEFTLLIQAPTTEKDVAPAPPSKPATVRRGAKP